MINLKQSNAAKFSYLIVSFIWYSCLIVSVLFLAVMTLPYVMDVSSLPDIHLNFPISTDVILFTPDSNTENFMDIDSAIASVTFSYVVDNYPSTYFILSGILLFALAVTLYGIYQLRALLKDIRIEKVFTVENINRIKSLSIVILALSPVEWLYHMFLSDPFSAYMQTQSVEVNIGSADFGFITAALLVYTLALVFEKGYEQYEELKLTV